MVGGRGFWRQLRRAAAIYALARASAVWTDLPPQQGRRWISHGMHGRRQMEKQYSFTVQPRQLSDFAAMCDYHQTSPESHFTRQWICSVATPQGRISLSDLRMIETQDGQRNERPLSGEQEWLSVLRTRFGIDIVGLPGSLML